MNSISENVLELLTRCRDEKATVTAVVMTGDSVAILCGLVVRVSPIEVVVLSTGESGAKYGRTTIRFAEGSTVRLQDSREVPEALRETAIESFDSFVEVDLPSGSHCRIFFRRSE